MDTNSVPWHSLLTPMTPYVGVFSFILRIYDPMNQVVPRRGDEPTCFFRFQSM